MHAKLLAHALENEKENAHSHVHLSPTKKDKRNEKAGARALGMRLQNKSSTWGRHGENEEKHEKVSNGNSLHPDSAATRRPPKEVYILLVNVSSVRILALGLTCCH